MMRTAHRSAFMPQEELAAQPRQYTGISWTFRARKSAGPRLSAFRAAFRRQRGKAIVMAKWGSQ